MLWCSWVKAATDRSHIKEQLNISRSNALHKYLQFLCTERPFEIRKQKRTHPTEASGTLSAMPDPKESRQHHRSKETKSWLLRENQGSWVRLPLPPARGRDQTASILQFNLCSLNMGDWCLVGHPRASIKERKSCYRSMSFWSRCWELGRTGCSSTPLLAGQKQRGEGGEEESMTWVLSHCPWGMMASPAMPLVQQLECSVPAGCTLVLKATGLQWPLKVGSIPLRKCLNMAGTKDPRAA